MKKLMCCLLLAMLAACVCVWAAAEEKTMVYGDFIMPIEQITDAADIPEGFTPLYTAAELQQVVDNPEGKYILMADISLADFDGLYACGFKGVLDGNGHTLSDMYVEGVSHPRYDLNIGLFCWVRDGEIRNLRVEGSMHLYTSGVPGGSVYMGGIAGYVFGSSLITNCVTDVDISYDDQHIDMRYDVMCAFGGVAGYLAYQQGARITFCHNMGDMTTLRNGGGIVGRILSYDTAPPTNPVVYACINSGSVFARHYNAGGIVGYVENGGSTEILIDSCANHGDVTGCWNVGGIAGEVSEDGGRLHVRNSINIGEITGTDSPVVCVGGIAGGGDCKVTDCVNVGDFTANVPSGIHTDISAENLTDCYYLDNVKGAMHRPDGEMITGGMLSAAQMLAEENFPGLDLEGAWILDPLATGWTHPYPRALLTVNDAFEPQWPLDEQYNRMTTVSYYLNYERNGSHAHSCHANHFNGLDVATGGADNSVPVYAVEDGVVVVSTEISWYSLGNYVILRHDVKDSEGNPRYIYSLYAHLKNRNTTDENGNPVQLKVGDNVKKGQQIGSSGYLKLSETSFSWHLHFEIYEADKNEANRIPGSIFSIYSAMDLIYDDSCYTANVRYGKGQQFADEFVAYLDAHYHKQGSTYVRNEGDDAPKLPGFTDGLTKVAPAEAN